MSRILKDEEYLQVVKELISQARMSIHIATFKIEITSKPRGERLKQVFDLLKDAAEKNVDVRVLTNRKDQKRHIPDSNAYAIRYLQNSRIKVKILPNQRLCHAKMLIIDRKTAILGSHNLSVKSCHNNFEVSYLIEEQLIASRIADTFDNAWATAKDA